MKLETDFIEKLAKLITANGLTEISLEDGEQAITIRKDTFVDASAPQVANTNSVTKIETTEVKPKGKAITSPMVGTFYVSTSPENEALVEVGSEIQVGDVVCVIEAMKLMNEIKSEVSGKITQICVNNGTPVEYGQTLMYVE